MVQESDTVLTVVRVCFMVFLEGNIVELGFYEKKIFIVLPAQQEGQELFSSDLSPFSSGICRKRREKQVVDWSERRVWGFSV